MTLLTLPVAMVVVSLLVGLFHNWLNFNEHGLGLISWGYFTSVLVLQIGSLVIIGVWLIVLPIFLHKRNAISSDMRGDVDNKIVRKKSRLLGIWSVVFGVIGIFW